MFIHKNKKKKKSPMNWLVDDHRMPMVVSVKKKLEAQIVQLGKKNKVLIR